MSSPRAGLHRPPDELVHPSLSPSVLHAQSPTDQQHAFETLYEVLCIFSRLLAPILPFMAEVLYQQLEAGKRAGAEDSVHLERSRGRRKLG